MAEDKWNVKGLRGSVLEELINYTNEKIQATETCSCAENTDIDQASQDLIRQKRQYYACLF